MKSWKFGTLVIWSFGTLEPVQPDWDWIIFSLVLTYLVTNRTIKGMVDQQELHDTFTGLSGEIWIGFDAPAFHDRHGTSGDRLSWLFNLHQAHATISGDRQPFMVTEPWDLYTDHGSGLFKRTHRMMRWNLTSKKTTTETEYEVWKLLSCSFT